LLITFIVRFIKKLLIPRAMAIISISLNDNILKNIDKLKEDLGFTGRSEVIRAGLRMLISDTREKSKLAGKVEGVMLAIHDDKYTEDATNIRHKHKKVIRTHIHNQLENQKCLEILVVEGNSADIINLANDFQTNKKMESAKLFVS